MKRRMSLCNLDLDPFYAINSDFLKKEIEWLFHPLKLSDVLFIPYAYEGAYYNNYINQLRDLFNNFGMGFNVISQSANRQQEISNAKAIVVGGGDHTKLLLGVQGLEQILKTRIQDGCPYLGWNEGGVVVSPSYVVPDVIPAGITGVNAVNFQIYCNYEDMASNRNEVRDFLLNNSSVKYTVCMLNRPKGSGIRLEDEKAGTSVPNRPGSCGTIIFSMDDHNNLIEHSTVPNDLPIFPIQ